MNQNGKRERKEDGTKDRPKRKQVLDGNAFYEIDLECVREKARREQYEKLRKQQNQKG